MGPGITPGNRHRRSIPVQVLIEPRLKTNREVRTVHG
jgi:hypothetical protein